MLLPGVFMIILGLGMTGKVPLGGSTHPRPPKFLITALSNLRRKSEGDADGGESTLGHTGGFRVAHRPACPARRFKAPKSPRQRPAARFSPGQAMLAFGLGRCR